MLNTDKSGSQQSSLVSRAVSSTGLPVALADSHMINCRGRPLPLSKVRNPGKTSRAAFAKAQVIAPQDEMVVPMGVMPKLHRVRTKVEHHRSFGAPRMYNV